MTSGLAYPINYEKTLILAKKEAAIGKAIEAVDDIEDRWSRITNCEEYTIAEINKNMLICDIKTLIECNITFINKIGELEALLRRQRPKGLLRKAKDIRGME